MPVYRFQPSIFLDLSGYVAHASYAATVKQDRRTNVLVGTDVPHMTEGIVVSHALHVLPQKIQHVGAVVK